MASRQLPPELNATSLDTDVLVALRGKLVQLIESVQYLQYMLSQGGAKGMPSWPEITSRYTILLALTRAMVSQLVAPPTNASEEGADQKWRRTLAKVAVHPVQPVAQSLDYQVGMLLTTKQSPQMETKGRESIQALPKHLQSFAPDVQQSIIMNRVKDHAEVEARLRDARALVQDHDAAVLKAYKHASRLRYGPQHSDDLFGSDDEDEEEDDENVPVYDWNRRLPKFVDPVQESEKLNMVDVVAFLRDGRRM